MTSPSALPALEALDALDSATTAALRERLVAGGFTPALALEADAIAPNTVRHPRLPVVRHVLAQRRSAGADLLRLFEYEDALPAPRLEALLGDEACRALVHAGVLVADDATPSQLRSRLVLRPLPERVFVFADYLWSGGDAVMGPSSGTSFLAGLIPAAPGAVLDVGCGAGSLALLAAARGATRSVGVDLNPRAVALARFNARLNGVAAEFRCGDLTAPVQGERFDLLLAQPPFVPRAPESAERVFMHGGAAGDELAARVLAASPDALAPAGRALVFFVTPVRPGPLAQRLHGLLERAPANLVALKLQAPSVPVMAAAFSSFELDDLGPGYAAAVERYLRHCDALEVRALEGVLAVVERLPAGHEVPGGRYAMALPCGEAALDAAEVALLLARLATAGGAPDALAGIKVRVDPRLRVVSERHGVAQAAKAETSVRFAPGALGVPGEVGAAQLEFLRELDAAPTVQRAVVQLARGRHGPVGKLRDEVIAFVRDALVRGWLVPERGP